LSETDIAQPNDTHAALDAFAKADRLVYLTSHSPKEKDFIKADILLNSGILAKNQGNIDTAIESIEKARHLFSRNSNIV
jgi:hypothetical protein